MSSSPRHPREGGDQLDDLEDRIKSARAEYEEDYNPKPVPNQMGEGANIAYEFLAYAISGGILGYIIDRLAGTAPWGFLICIILGFIGGVYRANERMKEKAENSQK